MPGLTTHFTVTDEPSPGVEHATIDRAWLSERIEDLSGRFYLCGPQGFVDSMRDALTGLGAHAARVHTGEGW